MVGPIGAAKVLEPVQVAGLLKDFGVDLDGAMGRKHPGATAARLLGKGWVGSAVGAQEKLVRSAGGGLYEGLSVDLGLWG